MVFLFTMRFTRDNSVQCSIDKSGGKLQTFWKEKKKKNMRKRLHSFSFFINYNFFIYKYFF